MTAAWHADPRAHAVQFYEDERFLHRAIAEFFADARTDEPMVMIARPQTFEAVTRRLTSGAADIRHRITFIDADAALQDLMDGDMPSVERVERGFSTLVANARRHGTGPIRVYGEMVDVLCRAGNHPAAIRLEELWNTGVPPGTPVSVLCGYALEGFDADVQARQLQRVCRQHTHVIPTERFTDAPDDQARFTQVALLEQRARVLDRLLVREPPAAPAAGPAAIPVVYIVDDDVSVRSSLRRLLASVNWQVHTFASAEAFLDNVDKTARGCLVVDVQLGGLSGPDLQRRMAGALWDMPVIAMSASPDPQVEAEALRMGARAFLRKPFDAQRLIDVIVRALS